MKLFVFCIIPASALFQFGLSKIRLTETTNNPFETPLRIIETENELKTRFPYCSGNFPNQKRIILGFVWVHIHVGQTFPGVLNIILYSYILIILNVSCL